MTETGKIAVTCSGCGQLLAVGADDLRAEAECLWCGTLTPIAARAATSAAVRAGRPPAAVPARPRPAPAAPAKLPEEPPSAGPRWFEQTPYVVEGATLGPAALPPPSALAPGLPPALGRSPLPPPPLAEDEDGAPYQIETPLQRPCPSCASPTSKDVAVCPACGFEPKTDARKRRTYEPVRHSWEAGWPLARRVRLFLIGQAAALLLGAIGAWAVGAWAAFLAPWFVFTVITAFLLGTYARTEVTRTERGKVRLTQMWRVCFVAMKPQGIRLSEYEGVVSLRAPAPDFWDWFLLVILVLLGIVPGFLWWYFVIRPDTFRVALTRDHGFPEQILYWGWDERQALDMAQTLQAVVFTLP